MPRLIGYARVSTHDQDTALQLDALQAAGCAQVFEEKASGKSAGKASRPQLHAMLEGLEPGDTVVVWKLDRFARSTRDALKLIEELEARGCAFRCLTQPIDTSGPAGRLLLTILAALAEFEVGMISERTRAGLQAAKERGRSPGRPKALRGPIRRQAEWLLEAGESQADVARSLRVSEATVHRLARELKAASRAGDF